MAAKGKDTTNPHRRGKTGGDGKIHRDTNLSRKTDAKSGYKHGSTNNARKDKK